ncbi:Ger(x)C family spore germination protein [Paenibacillus sp. MBLB4367]|uniref:Ger(x)C family spore germination protein n=1 Tax=Paenibacillus sp. MBLB4367 TaxID=3384767 RepID=UPI003907F43F
MQTGARQWAVCFLLFALVPLLSGCWSRVEINDRSIVTGVFIDKGSEPGMLELTLAFPLPNRISSSMQSGSQSSGNPYATVTKQGENFAIALRKIQSDLTRRIAWGHTRIIVIGRELAEEGIRPLLEFVARQPSFQLKTFVMVAPGKAREITQLTPVFERSPYEVLREFGAQPALIDTNVRDFLTALDDEPDMYTNLLTFGENKMVSEKGKTSGWAGTYGSAVFREGRMVGTLDVDETRALFWMDGGMRSAAITVRMPDNGKLISVLFVPEKPDILVKLENGGIVYEIIVRAVGDVISSESNLDLVDPASLELIQKRFNAQLEAYIRKGLSRTQQLRSDVLQLGKYVDWRYPKKWKQISEDWRDVYKNEVSFRVRADLQITRLGKETNPLWVKLKPGE